MTLLQVSSTYNDLQSLIAGLYEDMIPLASGLISVGQGLAGIAGVIFVFYKLWPVMAGREPLDVYPLLRPFAIFFLLIFFMGFVDLMNAVLRPVVNATNNIVSYQNQTVFALIKRKQELIKQKQITPPHQSDAEKESQLEAIWNKVSGAVNNAQEFFSSLPETLESSIRRVMANLLEIFFYAVGIVINAIRTFYLIILIIIGPLVLGFSVFPGFEGTFNGWLARYVQVYMWLPISNILGAIIAKFQTLMVEKDIERLLSNGDYDGADLGYLIFLLFGICSYLTVPTVSSWIIHSTGAGRALGKLERSMTSGGKVASAGAGNISGGIVGKVKSKLQT